MKKALKIIAALLVVLAVVYAFLPRYAQRALIYWYPKITDLHLFERDTVVAPVEKWEWAVAEDYNSYVLDAEDEAYIDSLRTVSFLVIQRDSIVFESYRDNWNDTLTSNLYSSTKSIVGLLAGCALDEGKIRSLDDPVSRYIPSYTKGMQKEVTVRDLLTMSGGMAWDEAYSSLFSLTTHGYYGDDLYALVTSLEVTEKPGVQFSYRSGETQLLAFVIEAATGKSINEYAEEKLWRPMGAERNAYWLLDKENGDEKAFCCFHTTARDAARFGRLMLNRGNWNGRQLVSEKYMDEAMSPAAYLLDKEGNAPLDYYGFQLWIMHYRGMTNPFMKGMLGQYVIAFPERDAILVRLGHRRSDVYIGENPSDLYRFTDIALKILDSRE